MPQTAFACGAFDGDFRPMKIRGATIPKQKIIWSTEFLLPDPALDMATMSGPEMNSSFSNSWLAALQWATSVAETGPHLSGWPGKMFDKATSRS